MARCITLLIDLILVTHLQIFGEDEGVCANVAFSIQNQ